MKVLSLDSETTRLPYSFPWQKEASLVCISYTSFDETQGTYWFNHNTQPCHIQEDAVNELQELIQSHDVIVAHNFKFDLHWFHHLGLDFTGKSIWCTQVGEYLARNHRTDRSISLAQVASDRGCTAKLDVVKGMWDEGYETLDIPPDILQEYCEGDTKTCLEIFYHQWKDIKDQNKLVLAYLDMASLKLFQQAEYNGMMLDVAKLHEFQDKYTKELTEYDTYLAEVLGIDNPGSSEQLSCGLFGGSYSIEGRVPGKRPGTTKKGKVPKEIVGVGFDPVPNTEAAKQGIYSTAIDVLLRLRPKTEVQKKVLEVLKLRSRASQMLSTFVNGLLDRVGEDGIVHHNLNQTVTNTGRLSCSSPNLQNVPRGTTSPIKQVFRSRY